MCKHLQTCTRATCSSIFSVNNIPTEHVLPRVGLPNSTRIAATWHEPSRTLKCVHLTGAPELVQLVGISRWWSLTSTASFREGSRKPRILRCGICGILVASFLCQWYSIELLPWEWNCCSEFLWRVKYQLTWQLCDIKAISMDWKRRM